MFDSAQIIYLEEVLGVTPRHFVVGPEKEVVILSPPLDQGGKELLNKVLGSVGVAGEPVADLSVLNCEPAHILAFTGLGEGRELRGQTTWWHMPKIESMCGTGAEVAALKKKVWNLLQQYKKENQ